MKTVDEFELTATTGATILPEDNGMAEEPSTSARHTGVSVLTVPTNRVEFTDHSNVMAESPMAGTLICDPQQLGEPPWPHTPDHPR